ncbi:potassium channel SKOR isoform X2 [Cajanus cajan]|uniref:potassium channel SKOR isoform X2 n=1 Tax=Cajanus cajan TaxID=3821 RepID=UPI0010FB5C51|nr:potassium channel SKOR isoform X2 [Cajanus cajan]
MRGDGGGEGSSRKRRGYINPCYATRAADAHACHPFLIHPHNRWYVAWKHFILIWAVYSSFFTPMEFGFFRGLPHNIFLLDIAGQLAFLMDILVRFFLASHSNDHRQIALRYLKSRFLPDLLSCLPWDYIYKLAGHKEPLRYLLWLRLTRALRVTEFFESLEKDTRVNYLFTRIVKLLVVELYCTHTAACIFYYLATTVPPSQESYTWIGTLKMGDYSYSDFRHVDLWKRYVTSLYFAIVTMATVGYGDIHAVNVREMIFVMIYVSFDMILGAYLLGNMTALIVKGSRTERFRDKMSDIIKYVDNNNLDRQIRHDIQQHLRFRFKYDHTYTAPSVLQDIPTTIRTKILISLYEQFIHKVSLFKGCSSAFIKQIATKVQEEFFLPGALVTEQGDVADQLYFVYHGELNEVKREDGDTEETITLRTHCYFGQISFFCNMPQTSTVEAREFSKVKNLSVQRKLLVSDFNLTIGNLETGLATRMNCAAHDGHLDVVKRLIGFGADPNKPDYDGRTPLHVSASKGYVDISSFLVEQGVNINSTDKFGATPLLEAIKNGHEEVASVLVNSGAILTIDDVGNFLCMTVVKKDLDLLKRVLACGINPNAKNYDHRTPLHVAASQGLITMAELLLEAGASVLSKDRWGNTPLLEAHTGGNRNMIKMFEVAKVSQLAELSSSIHETQATPMLQSRNEIPRKRCIVFPFHPWDQKEERKEGVVLWVPQSIKELIKESMKHLDIPNGSCILSEQGGKILYVDMINNDEKLFLVNEAQNGVKNYGYPSVQTQK